MSIDYKLSNIFGTVYSQGNLIFTPDGKSVLSPVGNRVSCFDLVNNKSFTFNYEHRKPISTIAINNDSSLMLSIDEDGRSILVNFRLRTVIHHMNFKEYVLDAKFSPDGKYIAVCAGKHIQLWVTPTDLDERQFAPFVRHRVYTGHYSNVTSVEWSPDSRFFLTSSEDMTAHIYSVHSSDSIAASTLTGHRDAVVNAYFSADQETIYTISKDGAQFEWKWDDDVEKWTITDRHYISSNGRVACTTFHAENQLLVVGFTSGTFAIYEMPSCNQIQTLTISQDSVDYVSINSTGEWLLFGAAELGQLLVWEWQSESYILKQQSHYDGLNALVYSPDGSKMVTGADDGKIKVWDTASGFAIVTFSHHIAAITSLRFSQRGNVLFSASLDGSVRAWDMLRYRNFRTFTAPKRIQFTSLAVDPSGELVCAGSIDDFDIHVWNVQSSQLVDRLSGHEGPISSLEFSPDGTLLLSGSWDHTARLWNFFGRTALSEPMQLMSEVLCVTFRPDGKYIAVSSMDGILSVWNVKSGMQEAEIDGKNDVGGFGRHAGDRFSAKNSARGKFFTNLCYSIDGTMILAGGNSRFVCLYDVANAVLLRKFSISKNMALDGTLDFLNSENMTEAGPLNLIDHSEVDDRIAEGIVDEKTRKKWKQNDDTVPGAQRGASSRQARTRPAIKSSGVLFSPTTSSFSVASTEGLLVYSIDEFVQFDPFELDLDVTVESVFELLNKKEYFPALVMAFRLGENSILQRVYESVPVSSIELVVRGLPDLYIARLLTFISNLSKVSPHIEVNLLWLKSVLDYHGRYIATNKQKLAVALRASQRFLMDSKLLMDTAQSDVFTGQVYLSRLDQRQAPEEMEVE